MADWVKAIVWLNVTRTMTGAVASELGAISNSNKIRHDKLTTMNQETKKRETHVWLFIAPCTCLSLDSLARLPTGGSRVAHNSPSDCCNCHRRRHKKLEFEDTIDICGHGKECSPSSQRSENENNDD